MGRYWFALPYPENGYNLVFHGLAKGLQTLFAKLRYFVQEKNPVMGKGYFSRSSVVAAAYQRIGGGVVVGSPVGALLDEGMLFL